MDTINSNNLTVSEPDLVGYGGSTVGNIYEQIINYTGTITTGIIYTIKNMKELEYVHVYNSKGCNVGIQVYVNSTDGSVVLMTNNKNVDKYRIIIRYTIHEHEAEDEEG